VDKIDSIYADKINIGSVSIPLGRVFKNEFLKKLTQNKQSIK